MDKSEDRRFDSASEEDLLGFNLYVEAIAEFLTADDTPPLTFSIEGQWGCGKSSFMLQLENKIKKLNSGIENSTGEKTDFTIWGNLSGEKKDFTIWRSSNGEIKDSNENKTNSKGEKGDYNIS